MHFTQLPLVGPELAAHVIRFLREPTSRSYILNYAAGRELCLAYVDGDPARFRRLLRQVMANMERFETAAPAPHEESPS